MFDDVQGMRTVPWLNNWNSVADALLRQQSSDVTSGAAGAGLWSGEWLVASFDSLRLLRREATCGTGCGCWCMVATKASRCQGKQGSTKPHRSH